jgi:hypothetical protein
MAHASTTLPCMRAHDGAISNSLQHPVTTPTSDEAFARLTSGKGPGRHDRKESCFDGTCCDVEPTIMPPQQRAPRSAAYRTRGAAHNRKLINHLS